VSQEAAGILDAQGEVQAADQARVNRLDALFDLVGELREARLRAVIGDDQPGQVRPAAVADLLDLNPAAYGLAETPPEIAAIVRGPAAPDEARLLTMVLDEAAALLARWAAGLLGSAPGLSRYK